ncbi:hypothetical protein BC830DRAFT_1145475 [Chytriomyces sp. MP71]|nr:hypothetical protein BC830DRAFT_1145475 [Chytriomyces sp. MP71]
MPHIIGSNINRRVIPLPDSVPLKTPQHSQKSPKESEQDCLETKSVKVSELIWISPTEKASRTNPIFALPIRVQYPVHSTVHKLKPKRTHDEGNGGRVCVVASEAPLYVTVDLSGTHKEGLEDNLGIEALTASEEDDGEKETRIKPEQVVTRKFGVVIRQEGKALQVLETTAHYKSILAKLSNKYRSLKQKDEVWRNWSRDWISAHKSVVGKWHDTSPLILADEPTLPPKQDIDKLPLTDEQILQQSILRLDAARAAYAATNERIPPDLATILSLLGPRSAIPPWPTEKDLHDLKTFSNAIVQAATAATHHEYACLLHIVFEETASQFDLKAFEAWVATTAVTQVFSCLGTLLQTLPFVPTGVGKYVASFGKSLAAAFEGERKILQGFQAILAENAVFVRLLLEVDENIRGTLGWDTTAHIRRCIGSTTDLEEVLEDAVARYEVQMGLVNDLIVAWGGKSRFARACSVLMGRVDHGGAEKAEMEAIRVELRDRVLLQVGMVTGRTLDAVQSGFQTLEHLEVRRAGLEEEMVKVGMRKAVLEKERQAVEVEKIRTEGELERLEDEKAKLEHDKTILEGLKMRILTDKRLLDEDLAHLRLEKDAFKTINKMHKQVLHIAQSIRQSLKSEGDVQNAFAGNLFHGVIIFDVAKSRLLKALNLIHGISQMSREWAIPFDPVAFDEFDWRIDVVGARFQFRQFGEGRAWRVRFNSELNYLQGESGTESWGIKVRGLEIDEMTIPPKYLPDEL